MVGRGGGRVEQGGVGDGEGVDPEVGAEGGDDGTIKPSGVWQRETRRRATHKKTKASVDTNFEENKMRQSVLKHVELGEVCCDLCDPLGEDRGTELVVTQGVPHKLEAVRGIGVPKGGCGSRGEAAPEGQTFVRESRPFRDMAEALVSIGAQVGVREGLQQGRRDSQDHGDRPLQLNIVGEARGQHLPRPLLFLQDRPKQDVEGGAEESLAPDVPLLDPTGARDRVGVSGGVPEEQGGLRSIVGQEVTAVQGQCRGAIEALARLDPPASIVT
jgi:hypothetical protein